MKKKMTYTKKFKVLIDISMFIMIICLMNTNFTGIKSHEIVGIGIFLIFTIHNVLNFRWIKSIGSNLLNKQVKKRNKVLFILDIILILLVIGITVTGIFISKYIFSDLFVRNYGMIKKIHQFLAWWSLILISIHIGFHLNTLVNYVKTKFDKMMKSNTIRIIVLIIYIVISIFGFISLTDRNVYKNFIPNFTTPQYGKKRIIEYKGNNRKFRKNKNQSKNINNNDNRQKGHSSNKINIFDLMNIITLFSVGTYYILNSVENKTKK